MEITGLGSTYMDKYRLSSEKAVNNPHEFADIIRRNAERSSTANSGVQNVSRRTQTTIDKEDKLYQLCLELETFLVKNLLSGMRSTIQKTGFVDDSFAGKMYEDMLYDEYAKDYTKNAGFGLAEQAYRQLKNLY